MACNQVSAQAVPTQPLPGTSSPSTSCPGCCKFNAPSHKGERPAPHSSCLSHTQQLYNLSHFLHATYLALSTQTTICSLSVIPAPHPHTPALLKQPFLPWDWRPPSRFCAPLTPLPAPQHPCHCSYTHHALPHGACALPPAPTHHVLPQGAQALQRQCIPRASQRRKVVQDHQRVAAVVPNPFCGNKEGRVTSGARARTCTHACMRCTFESSALGMLSGSAQ